MGVSKNGWLIIYNGQTLWNWMMTGGTPFSRNHHIFHIFRIYSPKLPCKFPAKVAIFWVGLPNCQTQHPPGTGFPRSSCRSALYKTHLDSFQHPKSWTFTWHNVYMIQWWSVYIYIYICTYIRWCSSDFHRWIPYNLLCRVSLFLAPAALSSENFSSPKAWNRKTPPSFQRVVQIARGRHVPPGPGDSNHGEILRISGNETIGEKEMNIYLVGGLNPSEKY